MVLSYIWMSFNIAYVSQCQLKLTAAIVCRNKRLLLTAGDETRIGVHEYRMSQILHPIW
jgi:hypothetical protein